MTWQYSFLYYSALGCLQWTLVTTILSTSPFCLIKSIKQMPKQDFFLFICQADTRTHTIINIDGQTVRTKFCVLYWPSQAFPKLFFDPDPVRDLKIFRNPPLGLFQVTNQCIQQSTFCIFTIFTATQVIFF